MTEVRLVNRATGSVVVVPAEKADELAAQYRTLGLEREESKPVKKAAAKRSSSKSEK